MRRCIQASPGHRLVCSLSAVALVAIFAPRLGAQTVRGVLLDRSSDRPIELALVSLFTVDGDSVDTALTDEAGTFELVASENGDFLLTASALGYRSTVASSILELGEESMMSLEFRMDPVPIEIGGLAVDVEAHADARPALVRNGFVDRATMGLGRFITPPEIAASSAFTTTELLARTGRITTRFRIGGDRILMRGLMGLCEPLVYVDGARVSMAAGMSLDAFVPLQVLDAVEIYRSPVEAPAQFAMGLWRCGVVVIWTKTR